MHLITAGTRLTNPSCSWLHPVDGQPIPGVRCNGLAV